MIKKMFSFAIGKQIVAVERPILILFFQRQLRIKQRQQQKGIEEKLEEEGKLVRPDGDKVTSKYCKSCKLIYYQVQWGESNTALVQIANDSQ